MNLNKIHEASFRDPSGFIFEDEKGILRRSIKPIYFEQYEALKSTGLLKELIASKSIIPHEETLVSDNEIIITPTQIPFITHPYEWSFLQFKHAALLTLQIHKFALEKGFILKDASAYNVTFFKGNPIFIDTLSFDFYEEGKPWRAYKQYIMHFFGPLVLAKYHGIDILKMLQTHIDGIPLKLLASLLPKKTKLSPILYTNIHLLAKMESEFNEDYEGNAKVKQLSKKAQINIITSLFEYIKKIEISETSEWGDYYSKINYNEASFKLKEEILKKWVDNLKVERLIDIGGNDGTFARSVSKNIKHLVVTDIDSNAIQHNYKQIRKNQEDNILTFVSDVLQPSPGVGFNNTERASLTNRLKQYNPDVTMGLALIHHLTLSGNVPFAKSAEFFASFSKYLIIEFPKREDSWVQSLLSRKQEFINHFDFYTINNFENDFFNYFDLIKKEPIENTERVLYLLCKK